jgi:hypothetical protein
MKRPTQVLGFAGEDAALRVSIAGAQEKTALHQRDGRWYLPRGATPTTHILKLPLGLIGGMKLDMRDSVENEWLCARILAGVEGAAARLADTQRLPPPRRSLCSRAIVFRGRSSTSASAWASRATLLR